MNSNEKLLFLSSCNKQILYNNIHFLAPNDVTVILPKFLLNFLTNTLKNNVYLLRQNMIFNLRVLFMKYKNRYIQIYFKSGSLEC